MSTLSKVASFILLIDQKYHAVSAYLYDKVAVKAYDAAEATFAKNKAKAIDLEVKASTALSSALQSIDDQAARARIRAFKQRDEDRQTANIQHDVAEQVRSKYENVGAVTASAAAAKDAVVKSHDAVRAQL